MSFYSDLTIFVVSNYISLKIHSSARVSNIKCFACVRENLRACTRSLNV